MAEKTSSLAIKKSPIHGFGVFANKNFRPKEKMLVWGDSISTVIFLNHSCRPTAHTNQPSRHFYTEDELIAGPRGIKKGQEVTFNYLKTRWRPLYNESIGKKCRCPLCQNRRQTKNIKTKKHKSKGGSE